MEIPLVGYSLVKSLEKLTFTRTGHGFIDVNTSSVSVFAVTDRMKEFSAFAYMCLLNLDYDGAPNAYGFNNPAKGSIQKNLDPLESFHKGEKGRSEANSQLSGLGNACGDPGDGTKGFDNFFALTRKFYWAGVVSMTIAQGKAAKVPIDSRAILEAGMKETASDGNPVVLPKGSGFFPVINPDTGYYISTTSVHTDDTISSAIKPGRYLNSATVPYAVWANLWGNVTLNGKKVQQGDYGLAIENATGNSLGFVFGDSGTPNKVGEVSKKMHETLGRGSGLVTFIAFPGSGVGKQMGANPEVLIPFKVALNTIKLHERGEELAARLAMGPQMPAPKKGVPRTRGQEELYKNFKAALAGWTVPD